MTVIAAGRECVLGTDQSRYQPGNSIDRYVGCRQFLVSKFSGGDGGLYLDGTGPQKNAAARGRCWRSAYHFLGNENSGEQQADFFVQATGGYQDFELPPTVDYETYGNRRPTVDKLRGFITELHRIIPRRWKGPLGHDVAVIIYSGSTMSGTFFPGCEIYDLWLAAYLNRAYPGPWDGVTNGCTPNVAALGSPDRYIMAPWRTWGAWQFAGGDGGAPGVGNERTNCDQDVMTTEMLGRLTGSYTPPTTPKDWFDTVTEDEFNIIMDAKLKPITDELTAVKQELEEVKASIPPNGDNSRPWPFKINGDGDWVIFPGINPANGKASLVRSRIPDGGTFAGLIDCGTMKAESEDWFKNPTSPRNVTDPDRVKGLLRIPEVPWPDPPTV